MYEWSLTIKKHYENFQIYTISPTFIFILFQWEKGRKERREWEKVFHLLVWFPNVHSIRAEPGRRWEVSAETFEFLLWLSDGEIFPLVYLAIVFNTLSGFLVTLLECFFVHIKHCRYNPSFCQIRFPFKLIFSFSHYSVPASVHVWTYIASYCFKFYVLKNLSSIKRNPL